MKTNKPTEKYQNVLFLVELVLIGFLLGLLVASLVSRAEEALEASKAQTDAEPRLTAVYRTPSELAESTSQADEVASSDTSDIPANEYRRYLDVPLSVELQDYIYDLCDSYDVPFELVVAVIDAESAFRADAVSATDDYGLMQINEIGHTELSEKLGIQNFLDPYQNVHAGIYVLSQALQATDGDVVAALMRYNCGPTGARRLWDKGVHSTAYTDKVMRLYNGYKETK